MSVNAQAQTLIRLHNTIAGTVSIVSVRVGVFGDPTTVTVDPPSAQAAAQPVINAFDWSDPAHLAWENLEARPIAVSYITSPAPAAKTNRAVASIAVDEFNILRRQIVAVGTQVWDPASIANGAGLTSPAFTVTGAAFGDFVLVAAPYSLQGLTATAYISAANTAVARLENQTGAAVNLASGTWTVTVLRLALLPDRTMAQFKTAMENRITAGSVDT